jgi:hypothetical protein
MPNYLQPGSDGITVPNANQWQRGLVFTGKPGIPSTLITGREYRITSVFKRKLCRDQAFTGYRDLYSRVTAVTESRIARVRCGASEQRFHTRILCHGWRTLGESSNIGTAFTTIGLTCSKDPIETGEQPPLPDTLQSPGGASLEQLARVASQGADEIFNEFDFRDSSGATVPIILSYGESAPTCEDVDFEPFIRRAEEFAQRYHVLLGAFEGKTASEPVNILAREWFCINDASLVTVHIYFQPCL